MQSNATNGNGRRLEPLEPEETAEPAWAETPIHAQSFPTTQGVPVPAEQIATRATAEGLSGPNKNKMLIIGGGLLAAVLFFVMTMFVGKTPGKKKTPSGIAHTPQQSSASKGSVTPIMDTVHSPTQSDSSGQVSPGDINRTKTSTGESPGNKPSPSTQAATQPAATGNSNLGSVPSFANTQQHWEEPQPYGEALAAASTLQTQQQQNALKEPSLVFVKNLPQGASSSSRSGTTEGTTPVLDFAPGTRILAKLTTEISSAVQIPVIAEAQYTYAVGDRVVIPAGAKFIGHLEQADRSGLVSVKFDEVDLKDDDKEKIEALGIGLDLAPIKGIVSGKNTGRNFLVRTASGIGSVAAMIVGNNTSSSFSEDDLIRERIAENAGNAGDTELMNLAVTNKVVVSVPADTKIYVVFAKREQNTATLRPIDAKTP
jgi:hypothetical protein